MTKLGSLLPRAPLPPTSPNDPQPIADFLKAFEDLGYSWVDTNDHVLGADTSARPNWFPQGPGRKPTHDHHSVVREPLVLFGYLAALTRKLELVTSILIAPQRQTALLAKQAAEIDVLSGGRLRLILAVGWNDVDYEGLGVNFKQRGAIMDEQIPVLRALWTQEVVTFTGKFHTIDHAGLNPLPVQRPIPIWLGGIAQPVLRRVGQLADGWCPAYPFDEVIVRRDLAIVAQHAKAAGRDPSKLGLQGSAYGQNVEQVAEAARKWKAVGATHISISTRWATDTTAQLKALAEVKAALGSSF